MNSIGDILAMSAPLLMFGLMIMIAFGVLFFSHYNSQKKGKAWKAMADRLKLSYQTGGFFKPGRVYGPFQDYQIEVRTITRGSGKNSKTYTQINTLAHPPLAMGLRVYREGFFSSVGKVLGFQDIQTGDATFDERFIIKGRNEDAVRRLLTPNLRVAMLEYDRAVGGASIDDEGIHWEEQGIEGKTERIEKILQGQSELVRILCHENLHNLS